ncbi:sensor histidine kinase [Sphaerisporangium dianthi]|uniref:histidine kinase n=1 Tax=Sphaerisporangium dianthi TaxID=1436120 RepID=A0ABV9CRU3_9ACTN
MDDAQTAGLRPSPIAGRSASEWPPGPRPGRLISLDALAATVYVLPLVSVALARDPAPGALPPAVQCLIIAGMGLPLAVRRLWPAPVFGVVLTITVLSLFTDMVHDAFAAAAFALYTVALTRPGLRWVPTRTIGAVSAVLVAGSTVAGPVSWGVDGFPFPSVLFGAPLMGLAWTVGRAVRERRLYVERSASELARRAVTDERLRIARELHDVVAHSMTLITVKAGVADHVAEVRPQEARKALREIEAVSRGALVEMRHMLGVLRSEGDGETAAELCPAPGLSELSELAERAALAGVRVELDVTGAGGLPEGVELSAYRIVQEALTNVVRHAAPAHCRVTVRGGGGEVRVRVVDDGPGARVLPGPGGPGGGHGLVGMRERVVMYGGSFEAGPLAAGGFAVTATLPYEPAAQDPPGPARGGRRAAAGGEDGSAGGARSAAGGEAGASAGGGRASETASGAAR